MFGSLGMPELIVIFVIALIIFGPRKLPELGRSLGRSLGEFKRASNELRNTLEEEVRVDEQREATQQRADAAKAPLETAGRARGRPPTTTAHAVDAHARRRSAASRLGASPAQRRTTRFAFLREDADAWHWFRFPAPIRLTIRDDEDDDEEDGIRQDVVPGAPRRAPAAADQSLLGAGRRLRRSRSLRRAARRLRLQAAEGALQDAASSSTPSPTEAFMLRMKIAALVGLFGALPVIL